MAISGKTTTQALRSPNRCRAAISADASSDYWYAGCLLVRRRPVSRERYTGGRWAGVARPSWVIGVRNAGNDRGRAIGILRLMGSCCVYFTTSETSMLPRIALLYGQVLWAACTIFIAVS